MADAEQQVSSQTPTTQVTSQTPATKQKNPKRVEAGKRTAEKTRQSREVQKKALIEAQSIIAKADPPTESVTTTPPVAESAKITTTQWLSVISIIVSLVGLYYKREEIKSAFAKAAPPSPVVQPPSPVDVAPARKGGIKTMD